MSKCFGKVTLSFNDRCNDEKALVISDFVQRAIWEDVEI